MLFSGEIIRERTLVEHPRVVCDLNMEFNNKLI